MVMRLAASGSRRPRARNVSSLAAAGRYSSGCSRYELASVKRNVSRSRSRSSGAESVSAAGAGEAGDAGEAGEVRGEVRGAEPADARHQRERDAALRKLHKPDHDDYLHSYKFKNSIERRFSRSQDTEVVESQVRAPHGKLYSHKRRRAARPAVSTSASASTEDAQDNSPQDTSSDSPHHHQYDQYEKHPPTQYVPVFALNALGKYYVPLSVEYACVSRQLRACDALDARAPLAALHPVTIHVNFTPCLNYHVKRDPDCDWRPV